MNLITPPSVQKLQTALPAKAKGSPDYRFYLLHDKLYRADVLTFAYRCGQANGGAEGVDGQSFADIEAYGVERWLSELAQDLRPPTLPAGPAHEQPAATPPVCVPQSPHPPVPHVHEE